MVSKGKVYFTLENFTLCEILKDIKKNKLKLGKDVGLLSHNDEPVKELLLDGITTYSTDFALMGKKAARFVLNKNPICEILPTTVKRRNSL